MKDDSLPYVYLDEDEDEGRNSKKRAKSNARSSSVKASGGARRASEKPYVYVDEDGAPLRRKSNTTKTASKKPASGRKNARKAPGKSSAAPVVIVCCLFVLVLLGGLVALDYFGIINLGIKPLLLNSDKTASGNTNGNMSSNNASDTSTTAPWFTPEDNGEALNSAEGHSISVSPEKLNVTKGLSEDWLNILLLGTDSRALNEPSRSDTMMICSVNRKTGEVKLTSLMRDTAVEIEGKGTVKLNTAYFYGGPNLAMATVNKYFGMNIEKYVVVNFSGFARIADALGGVDMNVTTGELAQINHNVGEQYYLLYKWGEMPEEEAKNKYFSSMLETAGNNIHLDGMQTLGYARIRKTDNDYTRTERQRKVLLALLNKMKGTDSATVISLCYDNIQYISTNLDSSSILLMANAVLSNSSRMNESATLRLPKQGTYKEETRDNVSMLFDMDKDANRRELYAYIYGS